MTHPEFDPQRLLTLTRRLLMTRSSDGLVEDVQILVGQLPPDLAVDLPLPAATTIIGSLVRTGENVQIVLDVAQPTAAILAFYEAHLTAMGWRRLDDLPERSGFTAQTEAVGRIFCQGRRDPGLLVSATETPGQPTDVRLILYLNPHQSPCLRGGRRYDPKRSLIPTLPAPAGATMRGGGGGSSGSSQHETATLETDLDMDTVAAHYIEQLQAAGWTLQEQGLDPASAWSRWQFNDDEGDPWAGMLVVIETRGQTDRYFAYLRVELEL